MPATTGTATSSVRSGSCTTAKTSSWRTTTKMNVRDLSNDDDFLSHMLIEKLGPGGVPLQVHRMDFKRRLPKTNTDDLVAIVHRLVTSKGPQHATIRQAVDELLKLPGVRAYLKNYTPHQANAFATHASRYFELYHPSGCIEITHTSRYTHRTGKSELCILATRPLPVGTVIAELKGSMADLTEDEERRLKTGDPRGTVVEGLGVRRDFSVIHSRQKKMNHLFLGPARFVNHDCENNVELFRDGRYITFRVIKPIGLGEELTTHYGDAYFGNKNKDCLCATCERKGRGGYAPQSAEGEEDARGDQVARYMAESSDEEAPGEEDEDERVNVHERRTRRGVYHVSPEREEADVKEESEDEEPRAGSLTSNDGRATGPISASSSLTSLAPTLSTLTDTNVPTPPRSDRTLVGSSTGTGGHNSDGEDEPVHGPSDLSVKREEEEPTAFKRRPRRSEAALLVVDTPGAMPEALEQLGDDDDEGRPRPRRAQIVKSYDLIKRRAPRKKKSDTLPPEEPPRRGRKSHKEPTPSPSPEESEEEQERAPTCRTCGKVLPIISFEGSIVYGDFGEEDDKEHDCPRCMRHFFIYRTPWPWRVYKPGTSVLPTPREDSLPVDNISARKVTHPLLPVLDRKLASAAQIRLREKSTDSRAQSQSKAPSRGRWGMKGASAPLCEQSTDSRSWPQRVVSALNPLRGRKRSPSRGTSAERPAKLQRRAEAKIEPSPANTRRLQSTPSSVQTTRSGRPALPSAKARAADEEPPKRKPGRPRKHPVVAEEDITIMKRKPGRPRKRPLSPSPSRSASRETSPTPRKRERAPMSEKNSSPVQPRKSYSSKAAAVKRQPREGSGRFGKKAETNGIHSRKKNLTRRDREERLAARVRAREANEREEESEDDEDEDDEDGDWETDTESPKAKASPSKSQNAYVSSRHFPAGTNHEPAAAGPPLKRSRVGPEDMIKQEEEEVQVLSILEDTPAPTPEDSVLSPSRESSVEVVECVNFAPPAPKPLGGLLFRAPNPALYRRRAWTSREASADAEEKPLGVDSDDTTPPVTPDDFNILRGIDVASTSKSPDITTATLETTLSSWKKVPTSPIMHKSTSVKLSPTNSDINVSVRVRQVVPARMSAAAWRPNPYNMSRRRFLQPEEEEEDFSPPGYPNTGTRLARAYPTSDALTKSVPVPFTPSTTALYSASSSLFAAPTSPPNALPTSTSPMRLVVAGWDSSSDSDS